ncbi:MAG: hypothetical protein IPF98_16860 [Gemmatimonadetes bacterium]|nr:hypothetical protein [Gemmatimonadota bacterium]
MRVARVILLPTLCTAVWSCSASSSSSTRAEPAAGVASSVPRRPSPDAPPALNVITEADLKRDLYALAGDEFRGREGGTLDELRASGWLADRMREAGLEPAGEDGTFFQWIAMRRLRQSDEARITIGNTAVRLFEDAATIAPTDLSVDVPLVFVEAGASVDPSAVRGKAVATALVASAANLPPVPAGARARPFSGAFAVRQAAAKFLEMGAVAVIVASDSAADANFARAFDGMVRGRYGVDTAGATAYWPDAGEGRADRSRHRSFGCAATWPHCCVRRASSSRRSSRPRTSCIRRSTWSGAFEGPTRGFVTNTCCTARTRITTACAPRSTATRSGMAPTTTAPGASPTSRLRARSCASRRGARSSSSGTDPRSVD